MSDINQEEQAMSSILSGGPLLPSGIGLLLIQITFILIVTRLLGGLMKKHFKQPGVVAEVLAGVLLGPSCLGHIPGYLDTLFPPSSIPGFELVANLGLVLYLFLVGLELEPGELFKTGRVAITIALSGIIVPFIFGVGVAAIFYQAILKYDAESSNGNFSTLAIFIGVGVSITAFPVLARILSETRLINIPIGQLALSAAAFNDAVAWGLLAMAIALVGAGHATIAIYILLCVVGWTVFLWVAVRPFLCLAIENCNKTRSRSWKNALLALVFICIFISSWFTAMIGTDAIFGSFLIGVILPRDEALVRVVEKFEDLVMIVFLPLYFTLSGLKADVATISSGRSVGILFLVLVAAVGGKLLGCIVSARLVGVPTRESLALGFLMNTRGLVELIVLNIGLNAHVINTEVFTIMVLMALVTTCMTSPIIRIVYPKSLWEPTAIHLQETKRIRGEMTRRLSRVATLSPGGPRAACNLNFLVAAVKAETMISGLYMLLPGIIASSTHVLAALFIDSTSTATLIEERIGSVTDPDAREITMAAKFLGSSEVDVKTILSPSKNVASQLVQLVNESKTDIVILPWGPSGQGVVDFELSMWDALSLCDATFILFHDQKLQKPRFLPGASAMNHYAVFILLYNQGQEAAVLDVAAGMRYRKDLILHMVVYRGATQETLELVNAYKLPQILTISTEEEMADLISSNDIDLIVYGNEPRPVRRNGRRHSRSASSSSYQHPLGTGAGGGSRHSRKPSSGSKPLLQQEGGLPSYNYGLDGREEEGRNSNSSRTSISGSQHHAVDTPRELLNRVHIRLNKVVSTMEVHAGHGALDIQAQQLPLNSSSSNHVTSSSSLSASGLMHSTSSSAFQNPLPMTATRAPGGEEG